MDMRALVSLTEPVGIDVNGNGIWQTVDGGLYNTDEPLTPFEAAYLKADAAEAQAIVNEYNKENALAAHYDALADSYGDSYYSPARLWHLAKV